MTANNPFTMTPFAAGWVWFTLGNCGFMSESENQFQFTYYVKEGGDRRGGWGVGSTRVRAILGGVVAAFGALNLLVAVGLYLGHSNNSSELTLTGASVGLILILSGLVLTLTGKSRKPGIVSHPGVQRIKKNAGNIYATIVMLFFAALFIGLAIWVYEATSNAIPYLQSLSWNGILGGIGLGGAAVVLILILAVFGVGRGGGWAGGGGGLGGSCPYDGQPLHLKKKRVNSEGRTISMTYVCENGDYEVERVVEREGRGRN